MQDPAALFSQINANPPFPEHEHLKCPRCDSSNTKFCYYNNYNLSQPRHFCKNCRRYWTKGGALRNIPVGGGSRKNTKRAKKSTTAPSPAASSSILASPSDPQPPQSKSEAYGFTLANAVPPASFDQDRRIVDLNGGSFSSLLAGSGGHFGNFTDGLSPGPSQISVQVQGSRNADSQDHEEGYRPNYWAELSRYTPEGSGFQQIRELPSRRTRNS